MRVENRSNRQWSEKLDKTVEEKVTTKLLCFIKKYFWPSNSQSTVMVFLKGCKPQEKFIFTVHFR